METKRQRQTNQTIKQYFLIRYIMEQKRKTERQNNEYKGDKDEQ